MLLASPTPLEDGEFDEVLETSPNGGVLDGVCVAVLDTSPNGDTELVGVLVEEFGSPDGSGSLLAVLVGVELISSILVLVELADGDTSSCPLLLVGD